MVARVVKFGVRDGCSCCQVWGKRWLFVLSILMESFPITV